MILPTAASSVMLAFSLELHILFNMHQHLVMYLLSDIAGLILILLAAEDNTMEFLISNKSFLLQTLYR